MRLSSKSSTTLNPTTDSSDICPSKVRLLGRPGYKAGIINAHLWVIYIVQSCWNGIAVLDPTPFYEPPHVKFRMAHLDQGECSASECSLICSKSIFHFLGLCTFFFFLINQPLFFFVMTDDYFNAGYGRIIMVPRVKLAYDRKVWDIIHPERRNLTAIRGYKRIGGLPDDPHSDPQDRSWYGPHDRLFTPEETEELEFVPGPEYGKSIYTLFICTMGLCAYRDCSVWCWGWDGAGDLDGPDVDPIWEHMQPRSYSEEAIQIKHYRNMPGW